MKRFLMYVLATMAAIFLSFSLLMIAGTVFLSSAVGSQPQVKIKNHAMLKIALNGQLQERATANFIADVSGQGSGTLGLDALLKSIRKAKANKKIKGLYLEAGILSADPASLQELRQAVDDFKKSGKPVIAYGGNYTQGCYYVCSAASKVLLNPSGLVDWHGLAAEPMFLKDMLAKFGVKMQVFKVGTYKSAVEPFTNTQMSEANREQVNAYLSVIWRNMVADVAKSRKLSADTLNALADINTSLSAAQFVLKNHLVDSLTYKTQAIDYLCELTGAEDRDDLQFVSPDDMQTVADDEPTADSKVAVYYAFGDVVSTQAEGMASTSNICAPDVIDDLQDLMDDDDVKAVVIRVNSGGGSAYASEQIWKAVKDLRAKKPVVISMGGMAASGAYYLSCGTDYIVADPTTLTGSIGIFGMFPDASQLLTDKLGLKFDVVKTNSHADFGTISRPLSGEEQAMLQNYVNQGYKLFISRVAGGRKLTAAQVEKIAEGRVWTGEQALKIGLVDELGNLNTAVSRAAQRAKLKAGEYELEYYPAQKDWLDQLIDTYSGGYMDSRLEAQLGEYYRPLMWLKSIKSRDYVQARIPYAPNIH